jgi:hypothetical protein
VYLAHAVLVELAQAVLAIVCFVRWDLYHGQVSLAHPPPADTAEAGGALQVTPSAAALPYEPPRVESQTQPQQLPPLHVQAPPPQQ